MLLISLIAASAAACDHPLDPSEIRNAYFLGSSNSESVNFLSKYIRIWSGSLTTTEGSTLVHPEEEP